VLANQRERVRELFRQHGVGGDIRRVPPTSGDEEIFVVLPSALLDTDERALTSDLQNALDRKVLIITDATGWPDEPEPL
jgi:hypothetical protein